MSSSQTTTWSNNWMSGIADDTSIAAISIPGTHDSCSRFQVGDAQCQWFSIDQQLNRGIRFLDIRCSYETGSETGLKQHIYFPIYHGPASQHILFEEVQAQCIAFLEDNPTEFILMNLQMDDDDSKGSLFEKKFLELIARYRDYWYLGDGLLYPPQIDPPSIEIPGSQDKPQPIPFLPTIANVRKKIVLIRSCNGTSGWGIPVQESGDYKGGLAWNGFNINDESSNILFRTQNKWDFSAEIAMETGTSDVMPQKKAGTIHDLKFALVTKYIQNAKSNAGQGMITLNFVSYTGSPGGNAQSMNNALQDVLKNDWSLSTGVLALDFTGNTGDDGSSLENLVIEHQPHQKPGCVYGGLPEWLKNISAAPAQ